MLTHPYVCFIADDDGREAGEVAEGAGDKVKSGDVLAEIETDKATMEVEVDEGVLWKISFRPGPKAAVNTPIAMLLGEGEKASTIKDVAYNGANGCRGDSKIRSTLKTRNTRDPSRARKEKHPGRNRIHRTNCDLTVREALRDAMAEEMAYPTVFDG